MVEVLTALEAEAAGLAARRMSAAEKAQLRKLHLASQAAVKRLDSAAYIKNNAAFHAAIYQGARNEFLAEQIKADAAAHALLSPQQSLSAGAAEGVVPGACARGGSDQER